VNKWFRFYSDAMRDPKVAKLSDKDFRLWIDLLCIASDNGGFIPPLDELKHILRRRLDHLKGGVDRLISAVLIDPLEYGYTPHHWKKFQYKSDISTNRVKKFRSKRNVSETPPDSETDTENPLTPKIRSGGGGSVSGGPPSLSLVGNDAEDERRAVAAGIGDLLKEMAGKQLPKVR